MDKNEATELLESRGYRNIVEVSFEENHINENHTHPFSADIVIVQGSMVIYVGEEKTELKKGDIFALKSQTEHKEVVGNCGVTYLAARST